MLPGTTPPLEKAKILDKYVKSNFNWNGYKNKFATQTVKDFLKTKKGNCAEINLYLTGLLRASGVEAFPVLLSTRDHGKIKLDYPFHHFFNYVIAAVKIDSLYVLLDATESLSKFSILPVACLNDRGLVVNKEKTEWLTLKSTTKSTISDSIDLKINPDTESASGSFQIEATGYDALYYRREYLKNNDLKKEVTNSTFTLSDSIKVENTYDVDKPLKCKFNADVKIEKVEDKFLISPFCGMSVTENPLKQTFRSYPVDMVYCTIKRFVSTIHIPTDYKILNKPLDINVDDNKITLQYHIEQHDNTLKVTGLYHFKKEVYESYEYIDIKSYFNRIVDKFNEKIVLVKN